MPIAVLLPLLASLAPLIPQLSEEIMGWVNLARQGGHFTDEQIEKIHDLNLRVHAEVQAIVARRAAEG